MPSSAPLLRKPSGHVPPYMRQIKFHKRIKNNSVHFRFAACNRDGAALLHFAIQIPLGRNCVNFSRQTSRLDSESLNCAEHFVRHCGLSSSLTSSNWKLLSRETYICAVTWPCGHNSASLNRQLQRGLERNKFYDSNSNNLIITITITQTAARIIHLFNFSFSSL
jgi:hypothetical protein